MKNKKFTLGLLLVIGIGLTALPMAAAQDFGGGDADSNEDEGSTGDFGGGDAGSNEDESTTDDSDGDFSGGDSDNNEDESDFGGGDADSNEDESDFGGGDSDNNEDESGEDPEDTEEDETDEEGTEDTTAETQTAGDVHVISALSPSNLQAELSSDTVSMGEEVTVSGQLAIDDNSNRTIDVLLNGSQETSATTDENGDFQASFTPSEAGTYTVELDVVEEELNRELDLEVVSGVSIDSLTTSGETRAGQTIEVCAEMATSEEVEVTLYQNNQQVDTATGQDQICFDPVLESGTNTFRAVASSNGESDEAIVSSNAGTTDGTGNDTGDTGTGAPTGGFLGSPTARVAAVGTLLVAAAIAVIAFARRKGALRTP